MTDFDICESHECAQCNGQGRDGQRECDACGGTGQCPGGEIDLDVFMYEDDGCLDEGISSTCHRCGQIV